MYPVNALQNSKSEHAYVQRSKNFDGEIILQ